MTDNNLNYWGILTEYIHFSDLIVINHDDLIPI